MNDADRRRYEMQVRVAQLGVDNAADFTGLATTTFAALSAGSPADSPNQVNQNSQSNDLSDTYGKVGNVIYNKKTMTVFRKPSEFFKDSGKKSFNGLKYDEQNQLPSGLKFVDGRKLTDEDYRKLK